MQYVTVSTLDIDVVVFVTMSTYTHTLGVDLEKPLNAVMGRRPHPLTHCLGKRLLTSWVGHVQCHPLNGLQLVWGDFWPINHFGLIAI